MTTASLIGWILSAGYVIIIVLTFFAILTDNTTPSKTLAWLLLLFILPGIGLILYYIFGYNPRQIQKPPTSYDKFKEELYSKLPEYLKNIEDVNKNKIPSKYHNLVELLSLSNDSWIFQGSEIEIITTGKRKFEALIEDLENAQHHIHFEYFYFRRDNTGRKIREILMRKAKEGVKVRFIYENIANIDVNPRFYYKMKEEGVEVLPFSKTSLSWIRRSLNYRDHRKIAIIDGKIGYTGGMNIGDEYAFNWRDTHLRIRGGGVYGLQFNFLHVWYESAGKIPDDLSPYFPGYGIYSENLMQVVPEAPNSLWPYMLLASVNIVSTANKYIYIQTPYYMPSDSLLQALKAAALSGVDVRIMGSRKADIFFMDPAIRSYYEESLLAGIKIYEYQDTFVHAKSMVVDDYISVIGTSNMDLRSLELSFEINTYMYDSNVAKQNYDIFMSDLQKCKEIKVEEWLKRPWWKRIIQSIMRLFSPLL